MIRKILFSALLLAAMIQVRSQEFSSNTIHIGVVVKDLDKSLQFYKDVIGMVEVGGFTVNSEVSKSTGLTGGTAFDVKTLKLIDSEGATEWKLMSFKQKASHPKPKYIQDDNGMQYTTIDVSSAKAALKRIKDNNVKLLGDTPTVLPDGRTFILVQDPDGTFIELIGPE